VLLEHGIGKPIQQIETSEAPEVALRNEERRERERAKIAEIFGRVFELHPELDSKRSLVHPAAAKVIEHHPDLAGEETKYAPPAPSSSIAPASVEQPATAPAASNGCDRVEQRPRVFALSSSPRARYSAAAANTQSLAELTPGFDSQPAPGSGYKRGAAK
jgi:hypothetical protein